MEIVLCKIWKNSGRDSGASIVTVQSEEIIAIHVGSRCSSIFNRQNARNDLFQRPGLSLHIGEKTIGIRERDLPIHLEDLANTMDYAEGTERLKQIPVHFIKNKGRQLTLYDFLTPRGLA